MEIQPFAAESTRLGVPKLPGYEDNPYILFLPAGCDRTNLRVSVPGQSLKVNGTALHSGEPTDVFAEGGVYTVETMEGTYPLQVIGSDNLPSLYITTESGSLDAVHADKTYKEPARLTVAENGAVGLENVVLEYIKGRGNSSWQSNEKRSYTIKFEQPAELLGMKAAKKWVLTSNNMDETLMRNAIAYSAAKYTGLPYTVDFAFADLYINGIYRGNYLVSEKIEVGPDRIDIADLGDANENANPDFTTETLKRSQTTSNKLQQAWWDFPVEPKNITGGYLLEFEYPDAFASEKSAFITKYGTCLILHSPEYATKGEIEFISSLYNELEEALLAEDGKNSTGKHFSEYLDMDSFIDGLLLYDFTANQDGGFTSWYIYLPENAQKFHMGPIWDFDQSMDNASEQPDSITVSARTIFDKAHNYRSSQQKSFIDMLFAHREIVDRMAERFSELQPVFSGELNDAVLRLFEEIDSSAAMDRIRWGYHGDQLKDTRLPDFVTERTKVLSQKYARLDAEIDAAADGIEEAGGYEVIPHKTISPVIFVAAGSAFLIAIFAVVIVLRKKKK